MALTPSKHISPVLCSINYYTKALSQHQRTQAWAFWTACAHQQLTGSSCARATPRDDGLAAGLGSPHSSCLTHSCSWKRKWPRGTHISRIF